MVFYGILLASGYSAQPIKSQNYSVMPTPPHVEVAYLTSVVLKQSSESNDIVRPMSVFGCCHHVLSFKSVPYKHFSR